MPLVERHQALPHGRDGDDFSIARRFGDQWLREARSAMLVVPSVMARLEFNAVVNPLHADASRLLVPPSQKVLWDQRLFTRLGA